jgi:hypothetical protein
MTGMMRVEKLADFDFTFEQIPGTTNGAADALSQKEEFQLQTMECSLFDLADPKDDWPEIFPAF